MLSPGLGVGDIVFHKTKSLLMELLWELGERKTISWQTEFQMAINVIEKIKCGDVFMIWARNNF